MKGIAKINKGFTAEKTRLTAVLCGVLIAYAITCIVFIACALALTYANLSEDRVPLIMVITVLISVGVAGFDASKGAVKNGWLWGMIAGAIYAVILICIETWVSNGFIADSKTITSILLSVAGGAFGGVIGINFKKK